MRKSQVKILSFSESETGTPIIIRRQQFPFFPGKPIYERIPSQLHNCHTARSNWPNAFRGSLTPITLLLLPCETISEWFLKNHTLEVFFSGCWHATGTMCLLDVGLCRSGCLPSTHTSARAHTHKHTYTQICWFWTPLIAIWASTAGESWNRRNKFEIKIWKLSF